MKVIEEIKQAWREKRFVLLFDAEDREAEVDMILPSQIVEPHHIATLRQDAGGLICTALTHELCEHINLPYISQIYEESHNQLLKAMLNHGLPYGAKSSFSVAINHVDSFTGITDIDRSLTIKELGKMASKFQSGENLTSVFPNKFRIPGHVPLLRGHQGLTKNRQGHTELSLVLCELTGFSHSSTMAEMMDSKTGKALSLSHAREYAKRKNYPFINGSEIIEIWEEIDL